MGKIDVTIIEAFAKGDGSSHTVASDTGLSVSWFKFDVEMACGFRMRKKVFVYNGVALDKKKNLRDYGIDDGSVIEVHDKPSS